MAIREKMKRAFHRRSRPSDTSSSIKKADTNDSNIYQPGEKMPLPKYRRPVAKEHKEKLESFSFAKAWRRKSDQSIYSPMGSKMPSRRNSMKSRKSMQAPRQSSIGSVLGQTLENSSDDADVANVGLSRTHTRDGKRRSIPEAERPQSNKSTKSTEPRSNGHPPEANGHANSYAQPFTPEDLTLALKRSNIQVAS